MVGANAIELVWSGPEGQPERRTIAPALKTLLDKGREFASAWGEHYGDVE